MSDTDVLLRLAFPHMCYNCAQQQCKMKKNPVLISLLHFTIEPSEIVPNSKTTTQLPVIAQ